MSGDNLKFFGIDAANGALEQIELSKILEVWTSGVNPITSQDTPNAQPTVTIPDSPLPTPTSTPSPTHTPEFTPTPTNTPSPSPTHTPSPSPTHTPEFTPTPTDFVPPDGIFYDINDFIKGDYDTHTRNDFRITPHLNNQISFYADHDFVSSMSDNSYYVQQFAIEGHENNELISSVENLNNGNFHLLARIHFAGCPSGDGEEAKDIDFQLEIYANYIFYDIDNKVYVENNFQEFREILDFTYLCTTEPQTLTGYNIPISPIATPESVTDIEYNLITDTLELPTSLQCLEGEDCSNNNIYLPIIDVNARRTTASAIE